MVSGSSWVRTDALARPVVPRLGPADRDGSVAARFAVVAALCPDEPAVRSGADWLTYADVDARSDALARVLLAHPTAAAGPVAVLLGHETTAIVAIMGVIKAGLVCVPLDAYVPPARLAQIVELAEAGTCVTDADHADLAAGLPTAGPYIDLDEVIKGAGPSRPGPHGTQPEAAQSGASGPGMAQSGVVLPGLARAGADPIALLFTSGSTGVPKGVVWDHRMLLQHVFSYHDVLSLGPGTRLPLFSPYSFAGGFLPVFWTLLSGSATDLYDARVRGVRDLAGWLRDSRPTALLVTPSMLRAVVDALEPGEVLDGVTSVATYGEAVYGRDVLAVRPHVPAGTSFDNSYGASETGPVVVRPIPAGEPLGDGVLAAGWALPGMTVRIERPDGTAAGAGETGEVVVVSRYISRGYWRAPELTAARFSGPPDGERTYRTGDLGRLSPVGGLEMLGRADAAVKVRGYLVEPAEIEAALLGSAEVADAVVLADRSAGPPRLVAYVVPAAGTRLSAAGVRRVLRAKLPSYMVPATVVLLAALPRTERGKIDRRNLPAAPAALRGRLDPPRDQWESAVVDLWSRALGLEQVGIHDDFVELGGDSLVAEELLTTVAGQLGVPLPTSAVIDAPTPAEFAVRITGSRAQARLAHPTRIQLRAGGPGATRSSPGQPAVFGPTGDASGTANSSGTASSSGTANASGKSGSSGAATPLFCFAGAGGLAVTFLALARRLGGDRPVYGLQAHGLERRGLPDWSVRRAARRHVRSIRQVQPAGPYLLAGHSFGGLVAYEAARQLTAAGQRVALLALLDSYPRSAGGAAAVAPSARGGPGGDAVGRDAVGGDAVGRTTGGGADRGAEGEEAPRRPDARGEQRPDAPSVLWVARDRLRQAVQLPLAGVVRFHGFYQYDAFFNQGRVLGRCYRPAPWAGPAVVYVAVAERPVVPVPVPTQPGPTGQRAATADLPAGWRGLLTGPVDVRTLAGEHDTILREPYVAHLAECLTADLAAALP